MKKITALIIIAICAISIYSCKKDSTTSPTSTFLKATVGGASFTANSQTYAHRKTSTVDFSVVGIKSDNSGIEIIVSKDEYNGTGTYILANAETQGYYFEPSGTPLGGNQFGTSVGAQGTLTITKDDGTTVEGTFSFDASEYLGSGSTTVTNGSFSVKYL